MQQVVDETKSLSFVNTWIPIMEEHYLSIIKKLMEFVVRKRI